MHNVWIAEDTAGLHINGLTHKGAPIRILGVGEVGTMTSAYNRFDGNRMDFTEPDHLTFVTIKNGEVVYQDQSPVSEHLSTAVVPSDPKITLPDVSKAE